MGVGPTSSAHDDALSRGTVTTTAEFQVVDVFSRQVFAGNPTCVVFPPAPLQCLSEKWMSKVARETNQPSTSFVDMQAHEFRTFGPNGVELPLLSGHSSLGMGAAVMHRTAESHLVMLSRYGPVTLTADGHMFEMGFPGGSDEILDTPDEEALLRALRIDSSQSVLRHGLVMGGRFHFAELTPDAFSALQPDIAAIKSLQSIGCFVTTSGMVGQQDDYVPECVQGSELVADFTVRNFVPSMGIDEDIATGSIQVHLASYWGKKLGITPGQSLLCLQASHRGGFVRSRSPGDGFVYVAGECALSLRGVLPAVASQT